MANTRAPTYTIFDVAAFRKKGQSLSDKLRTEFLNLESVAGLGMQCSACTLYGGPAYANIFHWSNPLTPSPVFVDHLIVRVETACASGAARMVIGRSTNTGALVNTRSTAANRALAANSYPTRINFTTTAGLPLAYATIYDSRQGGTGFARASTMMQGAYQYLDGRIKNAAAGVVAGTVYVFWYKAHAGG